MAEPLSLPEAKRHLRVEFEEDDDLIENLIAVARQWAEGFLNQPLVATVEAEAPEVPQKWKQAMLLVIGHWYQNRESVNIGNITSEIPMGAEMLLWQDRDVPV